MVFPATIDQPGGTAAQGTSLLSGVDHALDHRMLGSAIINIENKLGVGAGSAASNQVLIGQGAGQSSWGTVLNGMTLGTPTMTDITATNGTINNPVIGTPSINGGTVMATVYTIGSAVLNPSLNTTGTLDLSTATRFLVNMPNSAGSVTLAVTNPKANQPFILEILQGTAGNGTINFFSTIRWAGSTPPQQTFTGSRKDTFGFITTSTTPTFDGYIVGQNV